ncbi:MAG: hypothetical protein Q4P71_04145 [Actinomycetaceae bacterium]|nr:hypothetical protein [Actinomycetaceae bacterium]
MDNFRGMPAPTEKQLTPAVIILVTIAIAMILFIIGSVISVIIGLATFDSFDDEVNDTRVVSVTTQFESVG